MTSSLICAARGFRVRRCSGPRAGRCHRSPCNRGASCVPADSRCPAGFPPGRGGGFSLRDYSQNLSSAKKKGNAPSAGSLLKRSTIFPEWASYRLLASASAASFARRSASASRRRRSAAFRLPCSKAFWMSSCASANSCGVLAFLTLSSCSGVSVPAKSRLPPRFSTSRRTSSFQTRLNFSGVQPS